MFVTPRTVSQVPLKRFYTFTALGFFYLTRLDLYLTLTLPPLLGDYSHRSSTNYLASHPGVCNEYGSTRRQSFLGSRRGQSFRKLREH